MTKHIHEHDHLINSIIGCNAQLRGELTIEKGVLRIDGTVHGTLRIYGKVIVSATGIVNTDIIANEVIIGGEVYGNIYAVRMVRLLKPCTLHGNIVTGHLHIDDGVSFNGNCTIQNDITYERLLEALHQYTPPHKHDRTGTAANNSPVEQNHSVLNAKNGTTHPAVQHRQSHRTYHTTCIASMHNKYYHLYTRTAHRPLY